MHIILLDTYMHSDDFRDIHTAHLATLGLAGQGTKALWRPYPDKNQANEVQALLDATCTHNDPLHLMHFALLTLLFAFSGDPADRHRPCEAAAVQARVRLEYTLRHERGHDCVQGRQTAVDLTESSDAESRRSYGEDFPPSMNGTVLTSGCSQAAKTIWGATRRSIGNVPSLTRHNPCMLIADFATRSARHGGAKPVRAAIRAI